jgi:hypothetical protein
MWRASLRALEALTLMVSAAVTVRAASVVPPEHLGELARTSDAVVLAQAGAPRTAQRGQLLFTLTTFRVLEPVAGALETGDRITVETPGGELDGTGWLVPGSPQFEPGEVYLLFLDRKPTGEWVTRMLAYGLLHRIRGRDGSSLLSPLPELVDIQPFPRADGVLPEQIETYREVALLTHLRAVAQGSATWDARRVRARSEQVPFQATAQAAPAGCAFMGSGGASVRWQAFDLGQLVTMNADTTGDSSLSGGGFAQVQGALSDWAGIPGTNIKVAYGRAMSYTMTCTGGQDVPAFGTNIVMFNDPCGDLADLSGCSGTLGFGGPWTSGTHSFDGTTWSTITSWFVLVNNGAGCMGATNYKLMLEHELGHGLGFGHVSDSTALMYYMCCRPIGTTDTTCAQYLYPSAGGPTPTPTPTPTPGASPTPTPTPALPAKPTGLSATKGTYTDRVEVTWNWVPGATSYDLFKNTSDTAPASPVTSVPGQYNGVRDYIATPGVNYWYWVRAVNGSGPGPVSASDYGFRPVAPTPTPTSPPVPTPTPTPTPPAGPPAPTGISASDGSFSDRVRITWNASPGAVGYWIYRDVTPTPPSTVLAWTTEVFYDDATAVPGQTYWYWVRALNVSGASLYSTPDTGFRTAEVPTPTPTVRPTPAGLAASFTFTPDTPIAGRAVLFTDTSTKAIAWVWDFGDGEASMYRHPLHTYAVRGTYTVTLRVTDGVTTAQTTKTITVGERARLHLGK